MMAMVTMDSKRRPTLPAALLKEAGLADARELLAAVEGPGRIVLQDPDVALVDFQNQVAAGVRESGFETELDSDLLADRSADQTLR